MWGLTLCVLGAFTYAWGNNNDAMVVEGEWVINAAFPCPNPEQYPFKVMAKKSMLNRTTDCFDVTLNFPEEITAQSHGVYLEMCKKVDGGCKLQYTQSSESFCDFMKQYANDNFIALFANIGLENQDCPMPKGEMNITRFPFNYKELPETSIPGDFIITSYLTKGLERCSCFKLDCSFGPPE